MRTGLSDVTRVMSALVAAATIAACGGDDDDVTPPTPAISIALSSSALDLTQGTNGTATVNLTRSGGFTGNVAIAVDGLPGTVTYASAPATIDGNASSAIITFDVGESATPGVINATVKATCTGVSAEMAPLAITVVAAPTYTLAVANAAVTATQRPFDRRSRHRRSSVSGRVYHSTIPRRRRSLEPLSSLEIVVRVRLFATELRAD